MEDLLIRKGEIEDQLTEEVDEQGALFSELNGINDALGEAKHVIDPLWDRWEAQLAQGIIPDLDEMPPGAEP